MGAAITLANGRQPWTCLRNDLVPARVLMLGPSEAGKTTILHSIAASHPKKPVPELQRPASRPNTQTLDLEQLRITSMDLRIASVILFRTLIPDMIRELSQAVIYVVDSRMDNDAWTEMLHELTTYVFAIQETSRSPLLVMANFANEEGALPINVIEKGVKDLILEHDRPTQPFKIHPVNALNGDGVLDSLYWLVDAMNTAVGR
ncbi:ADP-ribosylation factor 6 [Sphaceloma murrayae]|uniref:ADP-ribosylation factor 6 n=1 Tax=Sphaceloma murrayae TaxID=2082308 RepID=A0A2K1QI40_9PEZI|nr:ADP-ribosylation factor 6 [Sphaceloma murrayae]